MWEYKISEEMSYYNDVLILVCVEVSVGERKKNTGEVDKLVLILVCVEVSVGEQNKFGLQLRI